jgi:tRNA pseudouridine38-40 synthase
MFKLVMEYDGTAYHGWQEQPAQATVAGALRDAIQRLTGERPSLAAAGRTDAGAHSLGQTVSFDLTRDLPPGPLLEGLNALLPADIAVKSCELVEGGFHARFSARRRSYRYLVENRPARGALLRHRAWHVRGPLDLPAMRDAAGVLAGEHDLGAFGKDPAGRGTVRQLHRLHVRRLPASLVAFELTANAFLYGMVRRIVGFLVEVGLGRRPADDSRRLLLPGANSSCRVAPARGLYQLAVEY